ncbi:hypothetical protein VNI00_007280 [Paramarasmius palmivorus]|uniref:F-box domain-containing protein n=1 Tax=Paramarasmius palmivorus TaxID=297713 RepID=A0AAW0D2J8_9AGAR
MPLYILPEILTEIFLNAVDTNGITDHDPTVAMSLSMVCSTWRSVALSISAIWARISAYFDFDGEQDFQYPTGVLQRLELHLTRSRSELLEVTLKIASFHETQGVTGYLRAPAEVANTINPPELLPLLRAILSESHRIRMLSLPTEDKLSQLEALSLLRPFTWKNLHSIDIKVDFDDDDAEAATELVELFGISNPNLRRIRFSNTRGHFPTTLSSSFPPSQITHLHVGYILNTTAFHYLSHFPALVSAELGIWKRINVGYESDEDVQEPEQPRLVLPHLRSLSLDLCPGNIHIDGDLNATYLFHDALTLPSLKNLAYTSKRMVNCKSDGHSENFVASLSQMLERSNYPVLSFRLECIPIIDSYLVWLLKQLPLLEVFEVRGADGISILHNIYCDHGFEDDIFTTTSQLLEALTLTPTNAQLLPRLRRIILWTRTDWREDCYPFETLLESRMRGFRPLESAYLHLVDEGPDTKWTFDWRCLKALQENGMAVKVVQRFSSNGRPCDDSRAKVLFGYE